MEIIRFAGWIYAFCLHAFISTSIDVYKLFLFAMRQGAQTSPHTHIQQNPLTPIVSSGDNKKNKK